MGVLRMSRRHGIVATYRTLAALVTLMCVVGIALSGGQLVHVQIGYVASTAMAVTGLHVVGIWSLKNVEFPSVVKPASESTNYNKLTHPGIVFYTNVESASKVLREIDIIVAKYTSEELVGIYRAVVRLADHCTSLLILFTKFYFLGSQGLVWRGICKTLGNLLSGVPWQHLH